MFKPSRLSLAVAVSLAPGASWAVGDDQPQMLEPWKSLAMRLQPKLCRGQAM